MRMEETVARERFAAARVARMATVTRTGAPHLVPVTFAVRNNFVVTAVDHKPKRTNALKRIANIDHERRVAFLVDEYTEEWDSLWWVRVDGNARIIDAVDEHEALADPLSWLSAKYGQYRQLQPQGPLILVQMEHVSGWASSNVN